MCDQSCQSVHGRRLGVLGSVSSGGWSLGLSAYDKVLGRGVEHCCRCWKVARPFALMAFLTYPLGLRCPVRNVRDVVAARGRATRRRPFLRSCPPQGNAVSLPPAHYRLACTRRVRAAPRAWAEASSLTTSARIGRNRRARRGRGHCGSAPLDFCRVGDGVRPTSGPSDNLRRASACVG